MGSLWIVLIISCGVCAWLSAHVAEAKGCDSGGWGTAGFFLGPLALLALAAMPDRRLHRYLRAIAENAGVKTNLLDKLSNDTVSEVEYSFKTPREETGEYKIEALIAAIANDAPELSVLVSPQKSKIYPSRIIANNSEGVAIAEAIGVQRLGTIYWNIKYHTS